MGLFLVSALMQDLIDPTRAAGYRQLRSYTQYVSSVYAPCRGTAFTKGRKLRSLSYPVPWLLQIDRHYLSRTSGMRGTHGSFSPMIIMIGGLRFWPLPLAPDFRAIIGRPGKLRYGSYCFANERRASVFILVAQTATCG